MPELRWRYGYAFALAIMATLAVVIIGFFRRRRWV
jgi:Mg2+ and Co2+ transporter CorA